MRLMTYNIHHWEGPDGTVSVTRVLDVIRSARADIVSLNEVFHPVALEGSNMPALAVMAGALAMHTLFARTLDQPFAHREGEPVTAYGIALLSRWPIQSAGVYHLPAEGQAELRAAIVAEIATPAGPLGVAMTHLDQRSEPVRVAQVKQILRYVTGSHALVGDFNALTKSDCTDWDGLVREAARNNHQIEEPRVMPHLRAAGYVDAYAAAGQGPPFTWPTDQPRVRIDYILLTPDLAPRLRACRRMEAPDASDHFPLIAELA